MNSDDIDIKKIRKEYAEKYYQKFGDKYDTLISLVGFSEEPIIRNLRAISPEHTYFIYTEGSQKKMELVIEECGLSSSMYDKRKVSGTDMSDIYEEIKRIAKKHDKVVLDISGGKKSMVGAAAIAAGFLGLPIIYSDYSEYDVKKRKPKEGSEYLAYLENPMKTSQDKLKEMGLMAFNRAEFSLARNIFKEVSKGAYKPEDESLFSFLEQMSSGMHYLSLFDFPAAYRILRQSKEKADKWNHHTFDDLRNITENMKEISEMRKKSEKYFKILHNASAYIFLISLLINLTKERKNRGDWVSAALSNYRLMEMMSQQRLAMLGIDTSNMIESNIKFSSDEKRKFEEYTRKTAGLPVHWKIIISKKSGLMQNVCILKAKGDYLMDGIEPEEVKDAAEPRNVSYMEHGIEPVDHKKVANMEKTLEKMLENFCNAEGISCEELKEKAKFPKIKEV